MDEHDVVEVIRRELDARGTTPFRAAINAQLPGTAIRHVLEGRQPRLGRLIEICDALGIEFYIGPPRPENLYSGAFNTDVVPGLGRFGEVELPVLGWAKCALNGHILTGEKTYPDLPMPAALAAFRDEALFYAIAKGLSMRPEGIEDGDYCLVSPATPLGVGLRVWLKDRQKRSMIKRLVAEDADTYTLRGWVEPDARGRQQDYRDQWMKDNVAERGVVLAVYRGKPDADQPPELIADPTPPPAPAPPEVARALGLEAGATVEDAVRAIEARGALGVDAVQAKLREVAQSVDELKAETEAATRQAVSHVEQVALGDVNTCATTTALDDPAALAVAGRSRQVEIWELAAAAGGGAQVLEERITGTLAFCRDWLERNALDPTQCAVINVRGDSMEPTLPNGCKILVDRKRRRRLSNHFFVLRTADGVVVKRLASSSDGGWILVSDNDSPDWPDVPWSDDADVIGEVKWMAKTLP